MINRPKSLSSWIKDSIASLCNLRIDSIVLVGQFSRFMKITFGGEPKIFDKLTKSLSFVTMTKSFSLANSQISLSSFSRPKWNTWLDFGYAFEKIFANSGERFASNKSFKLLIVFCFGQPQRQAQPKGLLW